jgi:small redox-active disulfide protein 2
MKQILVLGPGCPNCNKLFSRAETAARELGLACKPEKITDIEQITSFGVMMTPALVIDGKVIFSGKVPPVEELKRLFSDGPAD